MRFAQCRVAVHPGETPALAGGVGASPGDQVVSAASKKESSSATAREKKSRQHRSARAGPTRSNSVRRKSTNPRKFGLSCNVIHSACKKLFGSGCGAREAQSRYSHSATTRTESAAA